MKSTEKQKDEQAVVPGARAFFVIGGAGGFTLSIAAF
jgi:hypothetical protein